MGDGLVFLKLVTVIKANFAALLSTNNTLLPLFLMAYLKGDLKTMWHEPFAPNPQMSTNVTTPLTKYQDI